MCTTLRKKRPWWIAIRVEVVEIQSFIPKSRSLYLSSFLNKEKSKCYHFFFLKHPVTDFKQCLILSGVTELKTRQVCFKDFWAYKLASLEKVSIWLIYFLQFLWIWLGNINETLHMKFDVPGPSYQKVLFMFYPSFQVF